MKPKIDINLLAKAEELRDKIISLRPFPAATLIPAILRHEYVQSLEASHKSPKQFIDFVAERIISTQMDLLRLLNDGGVNGGVNLSDQLLAAITENPGRNAPALAESMHKSLRTIQRHLKALSDSGTIEFKGAPKTGGYYCVKK